MKSGELVFLGLAVLVLGMLLIFAGLLKESLSSKEGSAEIRGGGVIMIGPIPIIFGTDKKSAGWVIGLAIVLVILSYLLFRGR